MTDAAERSDDVEADLTAAATYPDREALDKECDLIMKGGITSGIIYPHAVCELARHHRIVNVGGTSAGAIVAAGAAAAEYGRERGGFTKLADLPVDLTASPPGSTHTRLFHLFQPQPPTAALYQFLAVFLSRRGLGAKIGRGVQRALGLLLLGPLVVCLTLPILALLGAIVQGGWVGIVAAAVLVVIGLVVAIMWSAAHRFSRDLPANHLGLCSGMGGEGGRDRPKALTEWLTEAYDDIAGLDGGGPLTFGRLREEGVDLTMFTTNLAQGTQHQLPLTSRIWAFDPAELRQLFPESVVKWMLDHAPVAEDGDKDTAKVHAHFARNGLVPLPNGDDLPVIVGVRMSLSFPILLSTVPLHAIDFRTDDWTLVRHRFSDGGITSNFPLHFFDNAIPGRPTFAIDLRTVEQLAADPQDNVSMPRSNRAGILARPAPVETVGQLAGAVRNSMQNWADLMQTHVPGYRDRIVAVEHTPAEGGMNLDMESEVVQGLLDRGRRAGVVASEFDMANHRWVRFRSFLEVLEDLVTPAVRGIDAEPPTGVPSFTELLDDPPSYKRPSLKGRAPEVLDALRHLTTTFDEQRMGDGASSFAKDGPSPTPELQIKPPPLR